MRKYLSGFCGIAVGGFINLHFFEVLTVYECAWFLTGAAIAYGHLWFTERPK